MSSQLSRAKIDEQFFFQRIHLDPLPCYKEIMDDLMEMAKAILADAVVQYVTKGMGFYETYHFKNGTSDFPTLQIEPDINGALVTQTAYNNVKTVTSVDFYKLKSAYLANLDDSNLLDTPISTIECRCSYHIYRDKLLLPSLQNQQMNPYVGMAKNCIAEAAAHFSWTNENIISNTSFYGPKTYSVSFSLHLIKLDNGVRLEQCYDTSTINVEFDFTKLKKISAISNDSYLIEQMDQSISIPILDDCMKIINYKVKEIIVEAATHFYRTREQLINKITLCGDNPNNNIGKFELLSEEDGVQVFQFYSDIGGENRWIFQKIDFTTLLKEAS